MSIKKLFKGVDGLSDEEFDQYTKALGAKGKRQRVSVIDFFKKIDTMTEEELDKFMKCLGMEPLEDDDRKFLKGITSGLSEGDKE